MIKELYDYIASLQIIDTHEHLEPFEIYSPSHDIFADFLIHYFSIDLISSGLCADTFKIVHESTDVSVIDKWKMIEKYWEYSRYTGYGQSLDIIARDVYGVERIDGSTINTLNDAYLASFKENHYNKILKEKSNIKISINDCWQDSVDPNYFILSSRIDGMVCPRSLEDIKSTSKKSNVIINSFDDYLSACSSIISTYNITSNVLKCGLAYERSLNFKKTNKSVAQWEFEKLRSAGTHDGSFSLENLQNYLFRYILGVAQDKGMVIQIHTGLQEGNGNILSNSNPSLLNDVFMSFPNLKFDIFHIGYPFEKELGAMCKMFPNVYIDMCWTHIISPEASCSALNEWLEFIPYNKISGFGGDYCFIDGVYGHQYLARKDIAKVLSNKVENKLFGIEKAMDIGKAILYDNPSSIFDIK